MKFLIGLVGVWLAAAIAAGIVGDRWLMDQWTRSTEATFLRDGRTAVAILQSARWDAPTEADPSWTAMEQLLDLDVVPSIQPATSAPPATSNRSLRAPDLSAPTWTQSVTGQPRLTSHVSGLSFAATDRGDATEAGQLWTLRLTRQVSGPSLRPLWWLVWCSTNLFGLGFAGVCLRFQARQATKERSLLVPWLAAVHKAAEGKFLLPPISDVEAPLEPMLTLIGENVNRQLTELWNATERSELVLGNLQEGVLAVDHRSQVLLANAALQELLELQEDNFVYRPLLEVIRIPFVTELVEYVLTEQTQREESREFGTPPRSLRLAARPLPLGDGRTGVLVTIRDETLIKRIESVRRDFVANASHELKTPLAAIRAYAETLQLGALDDRAAAERFVGNIITQADRINGLVQGMLQLSRVQAGTALRIENFDVAEALEPCLAAALAMADGKGLALTHEIPPAPCWLRSDRDGFQTIASNLLSNAVRYTQPGGRVQLRVTIDAPWLILTIRDTGIGMRAEDLSRIFERFYRAEKDRSADTGGTGLGLSIVKNLVQALDGQIKATSQPGSGSQFEVRLPLKHR